MQDAIFHDESAGGLGHSGFLGKLNKSGSFQLIPTTMRMLHGLSCWGACFGNSPWMRRAVESKAFSIIISLVIFTNAAFMAHEANVSRERAGKDPDPAIVNV